MPGPGGRGTLGGRGATIRLDVHKLSFSASFRTLIDEVGFGVRPGECVGILGPSGAGKSTLMKLVNGHTRDGSGEVRYDGQDFHTHYHDLKARIGYVPQDDIVHPSLTPASELRFAAQLRLPDLEEAAVEERVTEVLRRLELDHVAHTRNHRLSGGQRKRVSLGVELLSRPPVLFLDEPTSGLDPSLERKMMALFRQLAEEGRSVLVTTHVMESLADLHLVLVLLRGHLVFFGPPGEALAHFGVSSFPEIYGKLDSGSPGEWRRRYRESPQHQRYVLERWKEPPPEPTGEASSQSSAPPLGAGPPTPPAAAALTPGAGPSAPAAPEAAPVAPDPAPGPPPPAPGSPPLVPQPTPEPETTAAAPSSGASSEDDLDAELEALRREVRG